MWIYYCYYLVSLPISSATKCTLNGSKAGHAGSLFSTVSGNNKFNLPRANALPTNQLNQAKNLAQAAANPRQAGSLEVLSPQVLRQISALEEEKSTRNSAQQKIDSQLLYAAKMQRSLPVAAGVPTQRGSLQSDSLGRVLMDSPPR